MLIPITPKCNFHLCDSNTHISLPHYWSLTITYSSSHSQILMPCLWHFDVPQSNHLNWGFANYVVHTWRVEKYVEEIKKLYAFLSCLSFFALFIYLICSHSITNVKFPYIRYSSCKVTIKDKYKIMVQCM